MQISEKETRKLLAIFAVEISVATEGAGHAPKDWLKERLERMIELVEGLSK